MGGVITTQVRRRVKLAAGRSAGEEGGEDGRSPADTRLALSRCRSVPIDKGAIRALARQSDAERIIGGNGIRKGATKIQLRSANANRQSRKARKNAAGARKMAE